MALALAPTRALRAALYCRVSTQEQGQRGYSLGAQEQDGRRLADELDAEVVAVYTDQDSGASWDLPGLNTMLDAAKRREFDVLIVYDPDRLARRMAKQLVLEEELQRAGVTLRYCTLRGGDSAEDRLLKNVRSSIAEYEREKIALRTNRGKRAKAERGLVVGAAQPPYGYEFRLDDRGRIAGLVPHPVTADVVPRIFNWLRTMSSEAVADRLAAEGVPAPTPRGWSPHAVFRIGHNTVYRGVWLYGRRHRVKLAIDTPGTTAVPVPALVSVDVWEAVQRALDVRRSAGRQRRPEAEDPYELRGVLTCGGCNGVLSAAPNNSHRYYACLRNRPRTARIVGHPGCSNPDVLAPALEGYVWQVITATLLDPEYLQAGLAAAQAEHNAASEQQAARLATLDREIATLRSRLEKLVTQRLDVPTGGEMDRIYLAAIHEAETALARLQAGRAEVAAWRAGGLSPEEVLTLQEFAAEIAAGASVATAVERRRVYHLLELRAAVHVDSDGVRLGQRHRYRLTWTARIPLLGSTARTIEGAVQYASSGAERWRTLLGQKGVPTLAGTSGQRWQLDEDVWLDVWAVPAVPGSRADAQEPPEALVLRLRYGATSLLLPGDLMAEQGKRIVAAGGDLRASVLLVPHHGSRFGLDAELLAAISPQLAVISSGERNRFGHPAPQTLRLLEQHGLPYWRTDRDGTIELTSDGQSWTVQATGKGR